MIGLIVTAVMFGITVAALSFFSKRWRQEELERRRRRALLAAGARQEEEEDEDGNLAKAEAEDEQPEPVVLAFTEEEGHLVAVTLDRLVREMLVALSKYHKSYKAVDKTVGNFDTAIYINNKFEEFPESHVQLDAIVAKRLKCERDVLDLLKEAVRQLAEIGAPKEAQAALAALQNELKRVSPFRVSQLPARLAAVRMVATRAATVGEGFIKSYMGEEAETRKKVAKLQGQKIKVSTVPDSEKSEALYARLVAAYVEFRTQLKALTNAVYQCLTAGSEVTTTKSDLSTLRSYPSVATMEELVRVLSTAENRIQAHGNAQARYHTVAKEVPGLVRQFEAALAGLKAVVAEIDKIDKTTAPLPQKIVVARKVFTDWDKSIEEKSNEAKTSAVPYLKGGDVAVGTLEAPDSEPVKALMLQCMTIVFGFPETSKALGTHAYNYKRLIEERGFKCPEKPNDADTGVLTKALADWSEKMAANCHDFFGSRRAVQATVAQLTSAYEELAAAMAPFLNDPEKFEPKSFSKATALKLVQNWLKGKLDEANSEMAKHQHATVRLRPQVKTRDADQEQLAALKAAIRSMTFALAQAKTAANKQAGVVAQRPPSEPTLPAFVPADGAAIDFNEVISQIEAHDGKCVEIRRQTAEYNQAVAAAVEATAKREQTSKERREALTALSASVRKSLSDESSDELYLACLVGEKLVTLFL